MLPRFCFRFKRNAVNAAQFLLSAFRRHAETEPDQSRIRVPKVFRRHDPHRFKGRGRLPSDSPHVAHRGDGKRLRLPQGREIVPIDGTFEGGVLFRKMIRKFCQGLRGTNPGASRNADPLLHTRSHAVGECRQIGNARHIRKTLVDAVGLNRRHQGRNRLHHAPAHIAVKLVVGTEDRDVVRVQHGLHLKKRQTALQTKGLRLFRKRHEAPVVVAAHDDGTMREVGAKHPLAARVKRVSVNVQIRRHRFVSPPAYCAPPSPRDGCSLSAAPYLRTTAPWPTNRRQSTPHRRPRTFRKARAPPPPNTERTPRSE